MDKQSLLFRLRERARIRRQIDTRKSVLEGKPDRIAALLEEAADEIEKLQKKQTENKGEMHSCDDPYCSTCGRNLWRLSEIDKAMKEKE